MKLKQYAILLHIGRHQLRTHIVTTSYKKAAELIGVSVYQLQQFGSVTEPSRQKPMENPHTPYSYPTSGELGGIVENFKRVETLDWWHDYIKKYNIEKYNMLNHL